MVVASLTTGTKSKSLSPRKTEQALSHSLCLQEWRTKEGWRTIKGRTGQEGRMRREGEISRISGV